MGGKKTTEFHLGQILRDIMLLPKLNQFQSESLKEQLLVIAISVNLTIFFYKVALAACMFILHNIIMNMPCGPGLM